MAKPRTMSIDSIRFGLAVNDGCMITVLEYYFIDQDDIFFK